MELGILTDRRRLVGGGDGGDIVEFAGIWIGERS